MNKNKKKGKITRINNKDAFESTYKTYSNLLFLIDGNEFFFFFFTDG